MKDRQHMEQIFSNIQQEHRENAYLYRGEEKSSIFASPYKLYFLNDLVATLAGKRYSTQTAGDTTAAWDVCPPTIVDSVH